MLRPLLLRTAAPALPAAVCIVVINEAAVLSLSTDGLQVYGAFLLLVLCVLLAVAGGYLVAFGLAPGGGRCQRPRDTGPAHDSRCRAGGSHSRRGSGRLTVGRVRGRTADPDNDLRAEDPLGGRTLPEGTGVLGHVLEEHSVSRRLAGADDAGRHGGSSHAVGVLGHHPGREAITADPARQPQIGTCGHLSSRTPGR